MKSNYLLFLITSLTIMLLWQNPVWAQDCENNVSNAGEVAADQSICEGTSPALLTSVSLATAEPGQIIEYQWMQSFVDIPNTPGNPFWTEVAGATSETYQPDDLDQTTYFIRCARVQGCSFVGENTESNKVTITVYNNVSNAGEIAADQSICEGTSPALLTSISPAVASGQVVEYQWMQSIVDVPNTDGNPFWTEVAGATSETYQPGELDQTTYFIRCARVQGCSFVGENTESNKVTITVYNNVSNAGEINGGQTVCEGDMPSLLGSVSSATADGQVIEYQWMQSIVDVPNTDGNPFWTAIEGATSETYQPGELDQTTYFIRCARVEGCSFVGENTESNKVTVTVETCFGPVRPVLECVYYDAVAGNFVAVFGYKNDNDEVIEIPVGDNNKFHPAPQDRGQVTTFEPGRQVAVFEVPFDGSNLVWTLEGPDGSRRTATASANSSSCFTVANLNLTSECSYDLNERRWRVTNPNNFAVQVTWDVYGTSQTGTFMATPGKSYFFTENIGGANTTIIRWYDEQGNQKQKTKASNNQLCDICEKENIIEEDRYQLYDALGANNGNHSIWIQNAFCPGKNARFTFDDTHKGYIYVVETGSRAGWIHLIGTAVVTSGANCDGVSYQNTTWDVDVWFRPAQPEDNVVPKFELGGQSDADWRYWVLVENEAKLTHKADPNEYFLLRKMNNNYGLQVGTGANGKNFNHGASTWFDYVAKLNGDDEPRYSVDINKHGDFNIDLEVICLPEIACGDLIGEDGLEANWTSNVTITAKDLYGNVGTPNFTPNSSWRGDTQSGGMGIISPASQGESNGTPRFELGYRNGKTESISLDFGPEAIALGFNGADVLLSRFYSQENNAQEKGCWIAYGEDGNTVVGQGHFLATEAINAGGPGHLVLDIRTRTPFRYLEFKAGPYYHPEDEVNPSNDDSDYLIRELTILCEETCETCAATEVVSFDQGNRRNGTPVLANRSNASNALGQPNNFDNASNGVKFVSLGYGGELVLEFACAIINGEGNDLRVVETSYGNPSFRNYPEQAEVYASKDGTNWIYLGVTNAEDPSQDCNLKLDTDFDLDGKIDWLKYVKLVDITNADAKKRRNSDCSERPNNAFNNATDGFDVDAVLCLYQGADDTPPPAGADGGDNVIEYGLVDVSVHPNPAVDYVVFDFSEEPEFVTPDGEEIQVEIFDVKGQRLGKTSATLDNNFKAEINIANLPTGSYLIRINTGYMQRTMRVLKR